MTKDEEQAKRELWNEAQEILANNSFNKIVKLLEERNLLREALLKMKLIKWAMLLVAIIVLFAMSWTGDSPRISQAEAPVAQPEEKTFVRQIVYPHGKPKEFRNGMD